MSEILAYQQQLFNEDNLINHFSVGLVCATLLRAMFEIAVPLFKERSISVTSKDGRILE
jgi:hypothetical protein